MAVTKIIPIRSTIQRSINYICDPKKTDISVLIHSEHCVPKMAGQIFHHHLNQCRAGGNTIGRHLIQSFAPGEVDHATAHEIGKRLADEILGGRYAYVLATHVDRGHIHNHFVWGAADMVSHKRYRSNKGTYHEIRNISDRLCDEHNLSVIVPQGVGKSYAEWETDKQGTSSKSKLKDAIDITVGTSASFEDFIKQMEEQGYTIKRGKHISFKAPDQERFTRAKRLGEEYTEGNIKIRIIETKHLASQKASFLQRTQALSQVQNMQQPSQEISTTPPSQSKTPPQESSIPTPQPHTPPQSQKPIQAPPKPQPQPPAPAPKPTPKPAKPLEGILLWETIIAKADTAEIYNALQQHGGYQHFVDLMTEARIAHETIDNAIKANEKRIAAFGCLRKDIVDLNSTRKVYNEYQALKKSTKFFAKRTAEKFYEKHEDEIRTHQNALLELKDYERPLYTVKEIDAEIVKGKAANVENGKAYRAAKAEHTRFTRVHSKLYAVNNEHKPKPPKRQRTRSNDWER